MDIHDYKKLTEDLPIGYAYHKIICDTSGNPCDYEYIDVNLKFENFTGLKRKDIIGKTVNEVLPDIKKDNFNWIREYGKIAINGGKKDFEQYSLPLNKWFRITAYSPKKYYFVTFFEDITKEINAYEEQKILTNALNDAAFIINDSFVYENVISSDNNIIMALKNQMVGKSIIETMSNDISSMFINAILASKISNKKETIYYSMSILSKEKWFKADITHIEINGNDKYVANISDITEQKRYEKKLLDTTIELDRFFSVNLDLLCIADVEGYFIKVNKSWETILGYPRNYLEGKKFFDFIHPDDVESTMAAVSDLKAQEQVLCFVNRYRTYDGSYKYIEWRSHPYGNLIYAAARDITQRKLIEDDLYMEKEKFKTTLLSIADGVVSTDKNGNIIFLNKIAEHISGWKESEALNKPFGEVFLMIDEKTHSVINNPISKVFASGQITELANHTLLIKKDKSETAIENSAAPIFDKNGDIFGSVLVIRDVTEKKKIQNQIEYLSFHDYLTGLYNRRFFEEELCRMDVEKNFPISLIMLDVNGLKLTNDAFGHEMGDALLKKVSEVLIKECKNDDIVARIGGDEFALILPKTDKTQVELLQKRISDHVSKQTLSSVIISIAIGSDTKNNINTDINNTFKVAEHNMYKNKIKTSRVMRNQTLQLIIETLNNKYEQEQEHTEKVCQICHHIGLALNMPLDDIKKLELSGFFHDIGKIMVPVEILYKPAKLTDEEYEIVKRHSESGYQILKSVEEYSPIADIVLSHHERWDGNGYPRKMSGTNIPLMSRIINIADSYAAMTTNRPYRGAMSREQAILELIENEGKQFDPELVRIYIEKVLNVDYDNLKS